MQFAGVYAKTVRKVSLSKLGDGQIIILKNFQGRIRDLYFVLF